MALDYNIKDALDQPYHGGVKKQQPIKKDRVFSNNLASYFGRPLKAINITTKRCIL